MPTEREEVHSKVLGNATFDGLLQFSQNDSQATIHHAKLLWMCSFFHSQLSDVARVKIYMLMTLICRFYLFVKTEEELSKPLEQCVTREATA